MKKGIKFLAISIVMFSFASATFAQITATATATAVIQAPLTITNTSALSFGTLAASTAGTVTISTAGARSVTGGVTELGGTISAAAFTVTGIVDAVYTIGLPASVVLTGAGDPMTVDNIVSSPATTGTLTAGTSALTVGGILNVNAAQAAGTYQNTTDLVVTVNYQ
jgi:hypothetical protein